MASSDSDDDDSDDDAERIARVREMAVSAPKLIHASAGAADATNQTENKQVNKRSQEKMKTGNSGQDSLMTSTPPTDGLSKQERKRIKKARQRAEKRQRKELGHEREGQADGERAVASEQRVITDTTEGEVQPFAKKHKSSKTGKKDKKDKKDKKVKKEKKEQRKVKKEKKEKHP